MNDIFFTSDEHFGHNNIIQFCNRPWPNMEEMIEGLIARHNVTVDRGDTVYHLGDMFWRTLSPLIALDIMSRLHGVHYYINGNHEELFTKVPELKHAFGFIRERDQIYPSGAPVKGIVLDHYAGRVWHDSDKGSWQLYGHTHDVLPEVDPYLAMDVGVDANNYYPVSLTQVIEKMTAKVRRMQWGMGLKAQDPPKKV